MLRYISAEQPVRVRDRVNWTLGRFHGESYQTKKSSRTEALLTNLAEVLQLLDTTRKADEVTVPVWTAV